MNLELTTEEVAFREEMRKFFTTEFSARTSSTCSRIRKADS